jgi:hypothetical protein
MSIKKIRLKSLSPDFTKESSKEDASRELQGSPIPLFYQALGIQPYPSSRSPGASIHQKRRPLLFLSKIGPFRDGWYAGVRDECDKNVIERLTNNIKGLQE